MYRSKNAVLHSVSVLAEQASLALSNVVGLALRGTMRSMVDSLRPSSRLFDLRSRRNRQAKMCQLFFYNS